MLEGDALRKALSVIVQQKARLVDYDTMDEDDAKTGRGLGCNGSSIYFRTGGLYRS